MKKSSEFFLLFLISNMLIALVGCSSFGERNAKKIAAKYIMNKYGFKPEITDIKFSTSGGGMVGKGDYATVFMEYEGTNFSTRINYKDKSIPGIDNYEKNVLRSELEMFLKEQFSLENMAVKIYCGNSEFMVGENIRSINDLLNENITLTLIVYTCGLDRNKVNEFDFSLLGDKKYISIYEWDTPDYPTEEENMWIYLKDLPPNCSEHISANYFISKDGIEYYEP